MKSYVYIGILISLSLLIGGCYLITSPPSRNCPIDSLVLDDISFPIDANAGEIMSPLPEPSFESAGRTFYMSLGITNHDVYRYLSKGQASREYKHIKEVYFSSRMGGPWETPNGFSSLITSADQQYLACGIQSDIYVQIYCSV